MALFELKPEDLGDALALIRNPNLTIRSDQAKRVAELQIILENARPSAELAKAVARSMELDSQIIDALKTRDAALLEAGMAKRRVDELEAALPEPQ